MRAGNGWYGFALDLDHTRRCIEGLRAAEREVERPSELGPLEISVTPGMPLDADAARRYEDLGVERLIPLAMVGGDALVGFLEKLANDVIR